MESCPAVLPVLQVYVDCRASQERIEVIEKPVMLMMIGVLFLTCNEVEDSPSPSVPSVDFLFARLVTRSTAIELVRETR